MAKAKEGQETTGQAQGERALSEQQSSQERQRETGITRREQYAPSLWTSSPFAFIRRFSEEMDRLFEDFGLGRGLFGWSPWRELAPREFGQATWSPQVEVFERGGQFIVRADLPGLKKEDINVNVTDDAITIEGERRQESEERAEGYYRSERSYGSFYRSIPLPEGVNAENASATFRDGVLEITMPAPQRAARRRRLEIREASAAEAEQAAGRGKAAGQQ
jgi:HSP20 family protein